MWASLRRVWASGWPARLGLKAGNQRPHAIKDSGWSRKRLTNNHHGHLKPTPKSRSSKAKSLKTSLKEIYFAESKIFFAGRSLGESLVNMNKTKR